MSLVDLDVLKRALKITDTSEDDFLNDCITDAQSYIENYCSRIFTIGTYTEQHIINHCIFPKNFPIISVSSMKRVYSEECYNAFDINDVNYRMFDGYVELLDYKYLTMTDKLRYSVTEPSYIEITYEAGYEDSQIPNDLKLVAKLIAINFYQTISASNVTSEHIGDYSVTYKFDIPEKVKILLDKYKVVRV